MNKVEFYTVVIQRDGYAISTDILEEPKADEEKIFMLAVDKLNKKGLKVSKDEDWAVYGSFS